MNTFCFDAAQFKHAVGALTDVVLVVGNPGPEWPFSCLVSKSLREKHF